MIMDSLRYWVTEMHVDGFRFDLASALARELHEVRPPGRILRHPAPGPGAERRSSSSPSPGIWARAATRSATSRSAGPSGTTSTATPCAPTGRATAACIGEFAQRITGSSDLYRRGGRRPHASINFVTAHDGFTLADLVSYNEKHNEANQEDNRDGHDNNLSWNCGVEGATDDPAVRALRERQQRNLLATLLLSQGVPMLLAGDELGRTPARQQQRLLPGQRGLLDRLAARRGKAQAAGVHAAHHRDTARAPLSGGATSTRGIRCAAWTSGTSSGCDPRAAK